LGSGFLFAIAMLLLLRSPSMRRWGKPIASPIKFANPIPIPKDQPKSIRFTIDYAAEDKKYANETIAELQGNGHVYDESGKNAEVVFVLISAFKDKTSYNPEEKIVYPILLQRAGHINRTLQRIQWIDFRRGIGKLKVIAKLLSDPAKMLRAIGVTPTSNQQVVIPAGIQALVYYFTATGVFTIGGWLMYMLDNSDQVTQGIFFTIFFLVALLLGIVFVSSNSLVNRKGWLISGWRVIATIVVMGILFFFSIAVGFSAVTDRGLENYIGNSAFFGPFVYILGLLVIIPMSIIHSKDISRWFPAKAKV
jgi:hypothetical protein